jgi:hypothetical protein
MICSASLVLRRFFKTLEEQWIVGMGERPYTGIPIARVVQEDCDLPESFDTLRIGPADRLHQVVIQEGLHEVAGLNTVKKVSRQTASQMRRHILEHLDI